MPGTAMRAAPASAGSRNPLVPLLVRALRPLARLMLKHGMTFYEFSEIARWVFSDVALDRRYFAVPGRDAWSTTKTRAAVLSGLTRREVDRLASLPEPDLRYMRETYHRGYRILKAWQQQPGYQDGNGQPCDLPVKGAQQSLEALVRKHCRDITVRAMLDELEARGCVERLDRKTVRFRSAEYPALAVPSGEIDQLAAQCEHFMRAAEKRLADQPPASAVTEITIGPLAKAHRKALNDRLRNAAQSFLNQIQREMASLQQPFPGNGSARVALGVYHGFLDEQEECGASLGNRQA